MWTEQAATATVQCNGGVTLPTKMIKNNTTDNNTTMGPSLHLQFDHQEGVASIARASATAATAKALSRGGLGRTATTVALLVAV